MDIKAIYFDLDDTLHDHQKPFSDTFQIYFPNFLENIPMDTIYKKYRDVSDQLWENYTRNEITLEELRLQRTVALLKSYNQEITLDTASEFQRHYEIALSSIELIAEAPRLLQNLAEKGMELGIITNGPTTHQKNKLKALGLYSYIPENRIFISDEVGIAKPDPRIFHSAVEKSEHQPENHLFIGDSWSNDIVGAINAGWNAIWFNHRNQQAGTKHQPLKEIKNLSELGWD